MKADGVFSGGGMKALAFAGALAAAQEAGYDEWMNLAGTSAGAITATALAVGYTPQGLREFLTGRDLGAIADYGSPRRLHQALNLVTLKAIARGRALTALIEQLLAQAPRPVTEFGELDGRLQVIGTDLVHRRMVVFPRDAARYLDPDVRPWDPDRFPVADAVRISAGYPFMFPPVQLRHAGTGTPGMLVDGGVVSPFPIGIFDRANPSHPTWGFKLDERGAADGEDIPHPIRGVTWPLSMLLGILNTSLNAINELELSDHASRTIGIPTGDVSTLAFGLSQAEQQHLYDAGYRAAREFFARAPSGRNSLGQSAVAGPPQRDPD